MSKSKSKRKRKAAAAKHIVVTAPLKIHLPREFVAKPVDLDVFRRTHAAELSIGGVLPDPEPQPVEIARPWWKFWA